MVKGVDLEMTKRMNITMSDTAAQVLLSLSKEKGLTKSAFIEDKILSAVIPKKYRVRIEEELSVEDKESLLRETFSGPHNFIHENNYLAVSM